jgi:hypothetical protein
LIASTATLYKHNVSAFYSHIQLDDLATAGNGTTATGDATYTTDIPDNAEMPIFNTSIAAKLQPRRVVACVFQNSSG